MPFNQQLGDQLAPTTPAWRSATPADRLRFFRHAGELVVREKRNELSRGIGANGRRMKPRKHRRADGAAGPVLTPHDDRSRTARLMATRATTNGLTLFWHAGTKRGQRTAWGTILGFHAAGRVKGAPVRDVRLSKRGINRVRAELLRWWTAQAIAKGKAAAAAEREEIRRTRERNPGLARYLRDRLRGF